MKAKLYINSALVPVKGRGAWACRVRPAAEDGVTPGDWFNVFMLHQNRVSHSQSAKNLVKETHLARFLDFVIWGHEHECIPDPEVRHHATGGWVDEEQRV